MAFKRRAQAKMVKGGANRLIPASFLPLALAHLILSTGAWAQHKLNEATPTTTLSVADKEEEAENAVLQRHYPFYFAYGNDLSKVQLSFKTSLVRSVPLYFGYTQLMFWALNEDSRPFRDLTFNPELFYRQTFEAKRLLSSIDYGLLNHNSNGKSLEGSRSYNKSYLRLNFEKEGERWFTNFSVQAQQLHSFDPINVDIQDYIGPLAFQITFVQLSRGTWIDKSEISLQASPGGKYSHRWDYGGYQISSSFRLGGIHLVPSFYIQYYNGFAESLLNYNERVNVFRAGLIF